MISESCARILNIPIIAPGAKQDDIAEDDNYNLFKRGFFWMIHANSKFRIGGQELKTFFWENKVTKKRPEGPTRKLAFDPFARIEMLASGRLFMTTAKCHFGQARRGIKRGDFVCILLGCSVPVILRTQTANPISLLENLISMVSWTEKQ